MTTERTLIRVDWENSAEQWWHHAGRSRTMPTVARPLIFDGPDELIVDDDEAAAIMTWAASLPGWGDGPEHAPTPLVFESADHAR